MQEHYHRPCVVERQGKLCVCVCVLMCVSLTSSIVLVCVEQLKAPAGGQQPVSAIQTGSHLLTYLLHRQGALCSQQHIKHTQLTGREQSLEQRDRSSAE